MTNKEKEMELGHVPGTTIAAIVAVTVICFFIPILLATVGKVRFRGQIRALLWGVLIFIISAMLLEQMMHVFVLNITGGKITDNIWIYGLYGATAAAVFEETGRYLGFKFLNKKGMLNQSNGFMLGVGHGGAEAIFVVGLTYISNLFIAMSINSGILQEELVKMDKELAQQTFEQISPLWASPSYIFCLAGIERIFAIALQISFAMLMYQAVKNAEQRILGMVFFFHFAVDFTVVIVSNYFGNIAAEIAVAICTVAVVYVAYTENKKGKALGK